MFDPEPHGLVVVTSPQTWTELRVLFESGEYRNLYDLYEREKDKYSDMPSIDALNDRCAAECWDKDRLQEAKAEVKRRNLIEMYASLGMDEEEQARYRIKCVKAIDDLKRVIGRMYRSLNGLDPNSQKFTETLGKIKVLTDTMFKGMNTSLAALQDISKLTGSYAPEKEAKSRTYRSDDGIAEIEDMTEEEILQDLKRMRAAGISLEEVGDAKISSDERKGPNGE